MSFLTKFFNQKPVKTGIIFIVEDNIIYAKTLEAFIKSNFDTVKEIKIFPVGETCLMELHRNPDLIIMDYILDTKYDDAETGLEIVKHLRGQKIDTNIILLSSQSEIEIVHDAIKNYNCHYIKKDEFAFVKIGKIIKEI